MSTSISIEVGTTVKAVKYMSGEPEVVEAKFLGKKPKGAGYHIEYENRTFCAGYEMFEGVMILAFTY
jgi:hypothetical protein